MGKVHRLNKKLELPEATMRLVRERVNNVAANHLFNLTNRGLGIGSDGLCELNRLGGTARARRGRPATTA